jgi:hypothetical protein
MFGFVLVPRRGEVLVPKLHDDRADPVRGRDSLSRNRRTRKLRGNGLRAAIDAALFDRLALTCSMNPFFKSD